MRPVIVIPARYASTRLPGKPLLELAGKPMIQHVYERAIAVDGFAEVVIATDDERIQWMCESFGASVSMTSTEHETGSDRLAEVVSLRGWSDDQIVVNLQGDEPLTPTANLTQLAYNLQQHPEAAIATLSAPIDNDEDFNNPNIVKLVKDDMNMALYFSRAPIPYQRERYEPLSSYALRHIGMYAYRASFLKAFAQLEPAPVERLEKLEQLRALYHGYMIHVDSATEVPSHGVDTQEDIQRVSELLA